MANEQLQAALLERAMRERANRQSAPQPVPAPAQVETAGVVPAQPGRTLGQTLYENVIGSGAIDTPGERLGANIGQFTSGVYEGAAGLADLATAPARSAAARIGAFAEGGVEALDQPVPGAGAEAIYGPASQAVEGLVQPAPETTTGEFARTVGQFVPGAAAFGGAGASNVLRAGVAPGIASEAAGQLTEGTDIEPFARIVGAVAAPTAINIGTKPFQALFAKTSQAPTTEGLRALKNEAYRAADAADINFTPRQTNRLISRATKALDDADYVPEVDTQTRAAFKILSSKASQSLSMGQLDKIRQGLYRRYNADKSQVAILDMIDAIDDTIQSSQAGGELMAAARLANSRFKRAELLDNAFQKAADQTASTGSGGNIVNKYRQAVTSIINNPKQARWFSEPEIAAMRQFVQGSTKENILRLGGKLSPSGNGLMAALNLGAVAADPAFLGVTAAASGAKALADRGAIQGAQNLRNLMATGQLPAQAPSQLPGRVGGLVSGFINE